MKKIRIFIKEYYILIIVIFLISLTPYLFTQFTSNVKFDATTGAIGDTIGGITAPFINLLAAILVYISFKEQIKANKEQIKSNRILSKETSYSFINSLINNFQESYSKYHKLNPNKINKIYHFDLTDNLELIKTENIKKRIPKITDDAILRTQKLEINTLYFHLKSTLNQINIPSNHLKTVAEHTEDSKLEYNIKLTFLESIKNEYDDLNHMEKNCVIIVDFIRHHEHLSTIKEDDFNLIQFQIQTLNNNLSQYKKVLDATSINNLLTQKS